MENIIIIGASGHAKVIIDIIEKQGKYNIVGLLDDSFDKKGTDFLGYKIIGNVTENVIRFNSGIVAIGDNYTRYLIVSKIKSLNPSFTFVSAIHPFTAIAKHVSIGCGTVAMAGTIINNDTTIGKHCILNTKASVGHDNKVGDYVTVGPGATLGGNVTIGDFSNISIGANIKHGVSIGKETVIGAGATLLNDVPDNVVAYGTPAKIVRERKINDKYL